MKRTVLAVVAALSFPAAALAHQEAAPQLRPPPPPAPIQLERREVAELRQLVARLDDASTGRRDGRELAWIEAELRRACEREITEARAAQVVALHEVPGSRRDLGAGWSEPSSARLGALRSVRAGLAGLQGRFDWQSIRRARDLGAELVRLAALDVRHAAPPPPAHGEREQERDHGHGRS